jgi:hypothetical protein
MDFLHDQNLDAKTVSHIYQQRATELLDGEKTLLSSLNPAINYSPMASISNYIGLQGGKVHSLSTKEQLQDQARSSNPSLFPSLQMSGHQYPIQVGERYIAGYRIESILQLLEAVWKWVDAQPIPVPPLNWNAISKYLPWSPNECQAVWRYIAYRWRIDDNVASIDIGSLDSESSDLEEIITLQPPSQKIYTDDGGGDDDEDNPMAEGEKADKLPRKQRKMWKPQEDEALMKAVQHYGEGNWSVIRQNTDLERTAAQLSQRWSTIKRKLQSSPAQPQTIQQQKMMMMTATNMGQVPTPSQPTKQPTPSPSQQLLAQLKPQAMSYSPFQLMAGQMRPGTVFTLPTGVSLPTMTVPTMAQSSTADPMASSGELSPPTSPR